MTSINQSSNCLIIAKYPVTLSSGANGCMPANSGQVIDSISVVPLSFIVHEPSGIIERSSAMSLSESLRMYRNISVSLWCTLNTGCSRNAESRRKILGSDSPSMLGK